jgi:hypothetical protein
MIRRPIILILIVGCGFADTIIIKSTKDSGAFGGKINESERKIGIFSGTLDGKVYFRIDGTLLKFQCDEVISIYDDENNPVNWDCNEDSFVPAKIELNELNLGKVQKRPIIGGTLIAIGGALVFTTLGKECGDDCEYNGTSQNAMEKNLENNKEFTDKIVSTQKIGFGLIALGGVLVAFGI